MASQQVRVNKPIRDSFRSGIPVSLLYWNTQFYLNLKMLLNEISYSEYLCKDMHTDFILLPYLFFDSKLVCPIVLFSLYVHYLSYFCSISCTIFFTPCAISVYASSLFSYRLIAVPWRFCSLVFHGILQKCFLLSPPHLIHTHRS